MAYGRTSLEKQKPVPHREGTVMTVDAWMDGLRAQVYGHDDYHHHGDYFTSLYFTLLYFILVYCLFTGSMNIPRPVIR